MSRQKDYNIEHAKEVKPRRYKDYQKTGLYIVTVNIDVYKLSLKYIKANYQDVITERQGIYYIIRAEGLTSG